MSRLLGTVGAVCVAAFSIATPSISSESQRALHAAYQQVTGGQRSRAVATLNCILMAKGITVGLGGSGAMSSTVSRGIQTWTERLGESPFAFTKSDKPDIKVVFVSDIESGDDVQGQVHCLRQVAWGRKGSSYRIKGTILIRDNVDGRQLDSSEKTAVIEHELGHVLGLDDDENPSHLMGPFVAGQPVDGPTEDEVETVQEFRSEVRDALNRIEGDPQVTIASRAVQKRTTTRLADQRRLRRHRRSRFVHNPSR